MNMRMTMEATMRSLNTLAPHWNKKLSKKFSLAPADLEKLGRITEENYEEECRQFRRFSKSFLHSQLSLICSGAGAEAAGKSVDVYGIGLARDLESEHAEPDCERWIEFALKQGLRINLHDLSSVACANAADALQEYLAVPEPRINIREEGAVQGWEDHHHNRTACIFASQFAMVQNPEELGCILTLFGRSLRESLGSACVPRICLIHPLPENNSKPTQWEDLKITPSSLKRASGRRHWGADTTLYSLEELKDLIERGFEGTVSAKETAQHRYYHQSYSGLVFEPEG